MFVPPLGEGFLRWFSSEPFIKCCPEKDVAVELGVALQTCQRFQQS
jgi:hypothetical protein